MPVKNKIKRGDLFRWLKYVVFATNLVAILFLLLSLLAWTVSPSRVTFLAYLGLIFPITLSVNIGYLLFWIVFMRWRYVAVQLVVILLCWQPVMASFPIHFKEKKLPEDKIKVLTYNVRGFNWLTGKKAKNNPILKYAANSKADIVCFQEFAVSAKDGKNTIISEKEVNEIMKDYPYRSIIRLGKNRSSHKYGIACYSKFPILDSKKVPIESSYNGSIIHTLDIKGKKVTLVINHLESNRLTTEDKKLYKDFLKSRDRDSFDEMASSFAAKLGAAYKIREEQVNKIRQMMDEQDTDATIVCGDFNDPPISYSYSTIKGGNLTDAFANSGFGPGITYHENYFYVRIDFIMHSKAFESHNCTVDRLKYSDHYPLWAYLSFK